jgi:general secretion pathway protein G
MNDNRTPPDSLSAVGQGGKLDPWGRPYEYLRLEGVKGVAGKARKNKSLVPLNSDFDLYSKGKDGESVGPLTSPVSRDDVLRANDGGFIGLASEYE